MAKYPRAAILCVGIGRYQSPQLKALSLPPADAIAVAQALLPLSNQSLLQLLVNEQATKARIQAGLGWLANNVAADDLAVFYYSGHGARYEDQDNDEADNYDEFLCPYDTGVGGGVSTFIRDDEMREWLQAITAKTRQVAVLLDSCHSGDAVRLDYAVSKELPPDKVQAILKDYQRPRKPAGMATGEAPLAGHLLLAAAEAHQLSYEILGMKNSLFTAYMLEGLADAAVTTFGQLFKVIQGKMKLDADGWGVQQTPHLIPRVEGDLAFR